MRKIIIICLILLLTACSSDKPVEEKFQNSLNKVNDTRIALSNNHKKSLFSYYLPQSVGLIESNNISSRLLIEGNDVFMSLDVSTILNGKEKELTVEDLLLNQKFIVNARSGEKFGHIYMERLSDASNLLYVKVNNVFFLTVVDDVSVERVLEDILLISRTLEVKNKLVVEQFSNKETFSYEKQVIELFSDSIPDEGMIKDIIIEEEGE